MRLFCAVYEVKYEVIISFNNDILQTINPKGGLNPLHEHANISCLKLYLKLNMKLNLIFNRFQKNMYMYINIFISIIVTNVLQII